MKNRSEDSKNKYLNYHNKWKSIIYKARKEYYQINLQAAAGNIYYTWKILSSILKNKEEVNSFNSFHVMV